MSTPAAFRYRCTFAKTEAMRFTGHLDLHRAWERLLRRAGAPLGYTQGFNPRPRLNVGAALPLGCTGRAEWIDLWLEQDWEPERLLAALREAAPPGLEPLAAARLALSAPALQAEIEASDYRAAIDEMPAGTDLEQAVAALLRADHLPRTRRGKAYDLRPLVESLRLEPRAGGAPALRMTLATREGASGRPDEVLLALGLDPATAHIERLVLRTPAAEVA